MYKYDLASLMNNVMESKEHKQLFEKKAFEIVETKAPLKEVTSLLVKASSMLDELNLEESAQRINKLAEALVKNSNEKKVKEMFEDMKTLNDPDDFGVEKIISKNKEKEKLNELFDKLLYEKARIDALPFHEKHKTNKHTNEFNKIKDEIIQLLNYVDVMDMAPSDKDVDELSEENLDQDLIDENLDDEYDFDMGKNKEFNHWED